jgi:cyanate permease
VGAVLRLEGFGWLAAAFSLHSLAANGVGVHLVPYLGDRGFDVGAAAALAGAVGATQLLGRILFAPLEGRLPAGPLTAAVLLVQPLALLVLLLARGGAGAAAFVALYGAGRGAMTLARATTVAGRYGAARYASISGVLALCVTLAQAAGPLVAGVGHDRFGSYEPVFWGFVVVSAAAAGAALLARGHHPRRPVG